MGERSDEQSQDLESPMLQSMSDALGESRDLDDSELDEARRILEEADPILKRIKEENRRALEKVNRPPTVGSRPSEADPEE